MHSLGLKRVRETVHNSNPWKAPERGGEEHITAAPRQCHRVAAHGGLRRGGRRGEQQRGVRFHGRRAAEARAAGVTDCARSESRRPAPARGDPPPAPRSRAPQPPAGPPRTHQADEAEAAVAVDEDLAGLAVALEQPLEVLLRDVGGQVAHEEAAALRVRLLARLEEALDVDGEARLLVRPLLRGRGRRRLPGQRKRHGGRRLAVARC